MSPLFTLHSVFLDAGFVHENISTILYSSTYLGMLQLFKGFSFQRVFCFNNLDIVWIFDVHHVAQKVFPLVDHKFDHSQHKIICNVVDSINNEADTWKQGLVRSNRTFNRCPDFVSMMFVFAIATAWHFFYPKVFDHWARMSSVLDISDLQDGTASTHPGLTPSGGKVSISSFITPCHRPTYILSTVLSFENNIYVLPPCDRRTGSGNKIIELELV